MVNAKRTKKGTSTGSKTVKKQPYECKDGPWKGHILYLVGCTTMWMNIGGRTIRYVNGFMEEFHANCAKPNPTAWSAGNRENDTTTC